MAIKQPFPQSLWEGYTLTNHAILDTMKNPICLKFFLRLVQLARKFDGTSQNAKAQAVKNFEQFDVIFSRMDKNMFLGALNKVQSVSVLQLYLSQRIVDEISSYTNIEWKFLSYTEIIKSIQFLYIPLNLVIFQNIVFSYQIDKGESFLEFSSRVFRHLKLCSRLKSPEERDAYVEMHRCAILKDSLPPETLNTITKKEQIYRAFQVKKS